MNTPDPTTPDASRMTRAQRATLPLSADVVHALAEQHGVCIRPLAMRRIDTTTGRVDVVPVPCGSTREDQCQPCAEKARRLRMAQCREGWHLDAEPLTDRATPNEDHKALMATRADLLAAYTECKTNSDELTCEQIAESVAELDKELRALGVRGRLTPLDPPPKPVKRSTRRRQDAPNLPRRPIERRTVGQVFAGRYRPSTFLTLTLDSYGRVDTQGAAVDPDQYDYRRAARDAIHFPALVDRFWQNTRRCVGWDVQYFGTVEPQKRGAPHFHAAIRGAISRAELRAITAATYHQVWWPHHDQLIYGGKRLPIWNVRAKTFTDPDTGAPLPTWEQACEELTEPAHVVRFGDASARQRHPGRHRGSGTPRRLPHKIPHQKRRAGRRPRRARHRRPTRPYPPAPRRTSPHAVLPALRDMAALRHPTQRHPTLPHPRPMHRQGTQARTPGHRRTPRPGLPKMVQQDPRRSPGRTRRIRSATPRTGRYPTSPRPPRRPLPVGTPRTHRPRHPTPTHPAPPRHRRTTAMESRIHRRPARHQRPTTRQPFGNSRSCGVRGMTWIR